MVQVTRFIQSDHSQWRCKKCKRRNTMSAAHCRHCKRSRRLGTKAINDAGIVIGKLRVVNTVGDEFWEYFDIITVVVEH